MTPNRTSVLALMLVLLPMLVADARAQLLLAVEGVELHGTVRRVMPGAGTCNVLETDTSYETKKANHGAPMDVWRLDFSVRNGSGRWLDHLIARYEVESKWPDCTNWSGLDDARFRELNSDVPLHELTVGWSGTIGSIQDSGRNVVQPGQTLTTTEFIIVLSGDPEPRFSNWSMDFDFAVNPPPVGTAADASVRPAAERQPVAATAEQENLFWQSIAESTNPDEFEAYLTQFPNGVFRALAEARLAALRERSDAPTPTDRVPLGSTVGTSPGAQPPTLGGSVDFGDDTGEFARDGECDDPRFQGIGMSLPSGVSGEHGHDATDCRLQYEAGRISLFGVDLDSGYIDFGDDAGEWARNGECDDPRFEGSGMDSMPLHSDRGHDASDCRQLYDEGRIRLLGIDIGRGR